MYSPRVIEAAIAKYETRSGLKLMVIPHGDRDSWREHLEKRLEKSGSLEKFQKTIKQEEAAFIRNERVMSMISFRYWAHYATIERDGGGVCNFDNPWESTEIFLRFIAKIEEDMHNAVARGDITPYMMAGQPKPSASGILIAINKARQTAATTIGRLITLHRTTTQKQRRALAASINDSKIKVMYDRDKLCYDNLPFYLKPEVLYDEKCAHLHFDRFNSRIEYQVSSQKGGSGIAIHGQGTAGIGVGSQVDLHHLTELSTWFAPESLEVDFFPAIPRSMSTFGLEESTPFGRGNWWHTWTESVRSGRNERWKYLFIPWYAEPAKYRALPPEGWQPSETSLVHAQKVHDTSPQYVGKTVMLARESLYWWEVNRNRYEQDGNLNLFLTAYAATPDESFQNSNTRTAFPAAFLAELRDRVRPGNAFEIIRDSA